MRKQGKIICWFSGGVASAINTKYLIEEYGKDNVIVATCVLDTEHEDNERFMKDIERYFGIEIKRLQSDKYTGAVDVIKRNRAFQMQGVGAKCTLELKKKVRQKFEQETGIFTQSFGYTYDEKRRADRFRDNQPEITLLTPLIDNKMTKEDCHRELMKMGIKQPETYNLGFSNANCLNPKTGIGCVKGSEGYWNKIRVVFPEMFERAVKLEEEIQQYYIDRGLKSRPRILRNCNLRDLSPTAGRVPKSYANVQGDLFDYLEENISCDMTCAIEKASDSFGVINNEVYNGNSND